MSIIAAFAEDMDFVNGAPIGSVSTSYIRPGYSRCVINPSYVQYAKTDTFGPLTSCWVTCRFSTPANVTNGRFFGIGNAAQGLILGTPISSSQLTLYKVGTSTVLLAAEPGASISTSTLFKVDIWLQNYGVNATVKVYLNGSESFTFNGDVTIDGSTNVNCLWASYQNQSFAGWYVSEMIVADEDTRPMSLVTLYPTGPGSSNTFDSGTYADIDEVVLNDADLISSGTTGQKIQVALSDLPAGNFVVKDVRVVYRGIRGSTGITRMKCGIKSGSTGGPNNDGIDVGQTDLMGTGWGRFRRSLGSVNPITGNPWTLAEINSLELAFESLT